MAVMSATLQLEPPKVRWDLSALFSGPDDPKVEVSWNAVFERADAFAAKFRGKINSPDLSAATLLEALQEIEAISVMVSKPMDYSQLVFSTDSTDPKVGAFMQKQRERGTELSVRLLFFELELQAAPEAAIEAILADARLASYRHFVQTSRAFSRYRLSEKEEIVLEQTANTGSRAWVRFFEEIHANKVYRFANPTSGQTEELSQQEVLKLLRDPDRATRQAAADTFSKGIQEMEREISFTYNTILQDKAVEDRLRGFAYPEQSRHISNELDKETVDIVVRVCKEHYRMVARFYNIKRAILGLPELTHIDRYAPLFEAEAPVSWDEAKAIVTESFGSFSPLMAAKASEFFEKNWIDAEPRKGKQGGAFCAYNTPDTHPVVFLSYLNRMDDVTTLAHELGHGVHASLSREQSYFNFQGTLPLAELASTFGEMLVFEKLVAKADLKDRLALYAEKIEGAFATIFRQAAMFSFEQRAHTARRTSGEVSTEQFGEMWQEEQQAMFGDSVKLGEQHKSWWAYVSHFFAVPFYVYAYSFGELLVMSLYQMAKASGPAFEEKYVNVLKLGGGKTPQELMELLGVDLRSEAFWRGGLAALEQMVETFEGLWTEYQAQA